MSSQEVYGHSMYMKGLRETVVYQLTEPGHIGGLEIDDARSIRSQHGTWRLGCPRLGTL